MNHSEMERITVRVLNSKQLWNVNINSLKLTFNTILYYLKNNCKFCESYDKQALWQSTVQDPNLLKKSAFMRGTQRHANAITVDSHCMTKCLFWQGGQY